ncbi:flagellar biosynthetic protein FliR [Pyrinomonas sp.]|uniref:flagellar biosynthetic protein FliR n=1 Tax=Pyrinomonas sp. TaxID=2080306 RepID=UPI003326A23C
MLDSITIPLRPFLVFAVVLARVGGLVTFAPFWGHGAIAPRVRALLALMLAFCVTPLVTPRIPTPPAELTGLTLILIGEALIGCALGFVGRLVLSALTVAAEMITFQLGLSLASTIDPATHARTTALGTFAQMIGLMVLLAADGHHWFLLATVRSFDLHTPSLPQMTPLLVQLLVRLSADAFNIGVALAAPVIIALLLAEFALAVAGRVAPQLQIFLLGFPVKIAVGLWIIGATLYFLPGAVRTILYALRADLLRAAGAF